MFSIKRERETRTHSEYNNVQVCKWYEYESDELTQTILLYGLHVHHDDMSDTM